MRRTGREVLMDMKDERKREDSSPAAAGVPQPYDTPVLRVFGSVAAITAAISKEGQVKDGGPNNIKT